MQRSRSSSGLRLCLIDVVRACAGRSVTARTAALRPFISVATLLWIWTMIFTAQAAGPTPDGDKTDAQDSCMRDEACHSHYSRARAAYKAGNFQEALTEYQGAYALHRQPWLLINIGRTFHKLGRPQEALIHYQLFQQANATADAELQQRLGNFIAESLALLNPNLEKPVPAAATATSPPNTPQSAPQSAPTEPEPAPASVLSAAPSPPASAQTQTEASKTPLYKRWWLWTVVGVGVAGVITGIVIATYPTAPASPPVRPPDAYYPMF